MSETVADRGSGAELLHFVFPGLARGRLVPVCCLSAGYQGVHYCWYF